ncbi:hypothetical protein H0H87_011612, partial [Tephrocybe sp. NHM501043]
KDDAILPLLDLDGLETLVTAINNPMDEDASSSNMPVIKKSNLVSRSPLFGPGSLKNDTCAIQTVFGFASLKNNPSTTQEEDTIFPTADTPMDKDPSSPNMTVSKTSKESPLFDPAPTASQGDGQCLEQCHK